MYVLNFATNFSKQQGYHFIFNDDVKPDCKVFIKPLKEKFTLLLKQITGKKIGSVQIR
ncbi:hypothetical protein ACS2MN_30150 [Bacillus cereus group sp. BceL062]|uniref:hypothetical protein n=1 Tax=Bacillus cereus group sp. BceL062 TaxID=3445166 RepID=UPI003F224C13